MFLNGIEYPNQILDAIKSNSLVVFAGAGASIGAPTMIYIILWFYYYSCIILIKEISPL